MIRQECRALYRMLENLDDADVLAGRPELDGAFERLRILGAVLVPVAEAERLLASEQFATASRRLCRLLDRHVVTGEIQCAASIAAAPPTSATQRLLAFPLFEAYACLVQR